MSITKEIGYRIDTEEAIFGEGSEPLKLLIQAPYADDISNAAFELSADFTSAHLEKLSKKLVDLTQSWMNRSSTLFADLAVRVADV